MQVPENPEKCAYSRYPRRRYSQERAVGNLEICTRASRLCPDQTIDWCFPKPVDYARIIATLEMSWALKTMKAESVNEVNLNCEVRNNSNEDSAAVHIRRPWVSRIIKSLNTSNCVALLNNSACVAQDQRGCQIIPENLRCISACINH